ncbi:MAG: VCBS repeat-containing protein, partial [Muribaculaceae bacterium]|nr:VCBS repeat-containing protein [Muribaculaceae bacterium]
YLIFYTNDGKGNFKKTENSYNGEYRFKECVDLYGDGTYSVIATHQDNDSYSIVEFNVPKNLKPTPTKLLDSFNNGGYGVIDYDGDGYMDVAYMPKYDEYATVKTGKVQNTAPEVTKPKINVDKENGIIRVEWVPATDTQTSATDIQYIVGMGTEPGKYDLARMDAARELYTMMRTVSFASGEYYVAVQATDAGGLKSKWSEPVKYDHSGLYADFSAENFTYVGKKMNVLLNTPYNSDYKYEYEVGEGGEIVSSENGNCVVKYNSFGAKKIRLTVTADNEVAIATRELEVYAGEPNLADSNLTSGAGSVKHQSYFVDLDGDGLPEAIQRQLYENDGKGVYTLSGKMFNIDMYITGVLVDDVNMDGMPDIISTDYGSEYVLLNEGDLGFEKEDLKYTIEDLAGAVYDEVRIEFGENTIFDFDNDGRLDVFGQLLNRSSFAGYGVFRNIGNNKYKFFPVSEKNNDKIYGDQYAIADFNSDGLKDILLFNERSESYLAINDGGCKFSLINVGSNFPEYDFSNPARISSVEDVNNDGYQDIIFNIGYRNPVTRIYFGDKSLKFDKVASLQGATLTSLKIDINNDGIIDFIDDYRNLYFWQPDGTFWMEAFDYNTNNHSYEVVQYEEDYRMHYKYADVDGDGTPDAMGGKRRTLSNSKPTAPAGVTATASAKGVLISWTASKDEETPAHQLLYMISLKKKGATGEGAYIMSPMNSGNDKAQMSAMLTRRALRGVTSVLVPIDRFDSTSEYEVKVQAVDSWYASSPFSETYTFKVGSVSDIEAPAATGVGVRTQIKYVGNETSSQTWEWDGGNAVLESGVYTVMWNEPGVKNISCTVAGKKVETSIMVKPRPDLSLEVPSKVLGGAPVKIKLPAIFTEPLSPVEL